MAKDNITFVDMFDWEKDSNVQEQKLLDGVNPEEAYRLPARIVVIIKSRKDDDQTNERTLRGVNQEGV
jgi:erythromycin esterase-like protein